MVVYQIALFSLQLPRDGQIAQRARVVVGVGLAMGGHQDSVLAYEAAGRCATELIPRLCAAARHVDPPDPRRRALVLLIVRHHDLTATRGPAERHVPVVKARYGDRLS